MNPYVLLIYNIVVPSGCCSCCRYAIFASLNNIRNYTAPAATDWLRFYNSRAAPYNHAFIIHTQIYIYIYINLVPAWYIYGHCRGGSCIGVVFDPRRKYFKTTQEKNKSVRHVLRQLLCAILTGQHKINIVNKHCNNRYVKYRQKCVPTYLNTTRTVYTHFRCLKTYWTSLGPLNSLYSH